jgi:glutamate:GABA antiporter
MAGHSELRRELGLRDLVLFNVAAVIGIRWLAAAAQAGAGSIALWLTAAALFFVPSGLAVAALSARHPAEGGIYVWTGEAFGPWHGFLCGWCYWLSNLFYLPSLLIAGVAMAATAFGFSQQPAAVTALAVVILWTVLLANIAGLGIGKWISHAGALATYLAGACLLAAGLAAWWQNGFATPMQVLPEWSFKKLNFWSQIAFAFGGLELGAVLGGEIRDPGRTVPRAAWISGLLIAAFYILGTLALLALLPPDRISPVSGLVQAGQAAGARLGLMWLGAGVVALVLVAVTGQTASWIAGSARVPFVIGIDRYLPPALGRVHPRFGTPYIAILWQGGLCTVFLLAVQAGESVRVGYQLLVDLTVVTYFIPFLYLFGAAWKAGGRIGPASGIAVTLFAVGLSLIPPDGVASVAAFEAKLVGGCGLLVLAARMVFRTAARPPAYNMQ